MTESEVDRLIHRVTLRLRQELTEEFGQRLRRSHVELKDLIGSCARMETHTRDLVDALTLRVTVLEDSLVADGKLTAELQKQTANLALAIVALETRLDDVTTQQIRTTDITHHIDERVTAAVDEVAELKDRVTTLVRLAGRP